MLSLGSPFQGKTRSWGSCGICTGRPFASHVARDPPLSVSQTPGYPWSCCPTCQRGPWAALSRLGTTVLLWGPAQAPRHCQAAESHWQTSIPCPFRSLVPLPHCLLPPFTAFWEWDTVSGRSFGFVGAKPGRQVCSFQLQFFGPGI